MFSSTVRCRAGHEVDVLMDRRLDTGTEVSEFCPPCGKLRRMEVDNLEAFCRGERESRRAHDRGVGTHTTARDGKRYYGGTGIPPRRIGGPPEDRNARLKEKYHAKIGGYYVPEPSIQRDVARAKAQGRLR